MTLPVALALALAAAALIAIAVLVLYLRAIAERLEAAVEAQRRRPIVGELCIVNTPAPDDQALRGVVREEYPDGSLLLGAAAYLAGDGTALAAGDVYVPRVSWVQVGVEADADGRRGEV